MLCEYVKKTKTKRQQPIALFGCFLKKMLMLLLLFEMVYLACDDNCTGVLLNNLDSLSENILSLNLTGVVHVPSGILSELENATKHLKVIQTYK